MTPGIPVLTLLLPKVSHQHDNEKKESYQQKEPKARNDSNKKKNPPLSKEKIVLEFRVRMSEREKRERKMMAYIFLPPTSLD